MAECPNQTQNAASCTCTYPCSKRGMCCACVAQHRAAGEIPGCFFPPEAERTYNRSVAYFVQVMKDRV